MATMLAVNRTRKKRKSPKRKAASPRKRRSYAPSKPVRRRRRRNPVGATGVMKQVGTSFIGASGALATDLILQKMPIPANYKTGWAAGITRAIGAISLGWGMKQMRMGNIGNQMTQGALTVILSDVLRQTVGKQVGLSGMGIAEDYDMDLELMGLGQGSEFDDIEFAGLGAGVDDEFDDLLDGYEEMSGYEQMSGMGYMSPAHVLSGIEGEAI